MPCDVCGHRLQPTAEKAQQPSAYPSEILPGFLYLGNYDNASRCELLKALDITHILNVRQPAPLHVYLRRRCAQRRAVLHSA